MFSTHMSHFDIELLLVLAISRIDALTIVNVM